MRSWDWEGRVEFRGDLGYTNKHSVPTYQGHPRTRHP